MPPRPDTRPDVALPPPGSLIKRLACRLMILGRGRVVWVLGLNAVAGLAEGVGLLALVPMLRLLGVGEGDATDGHFLMVLGGYLAIVLAVVLILRRRTEAAHALSLDFQSRLRSDLHNAILTMEWARFSTLRQADLQQVIMGETVRIANAVAMLAQFISAALSIPFVLGASVWLSPTLTLSAFLVTAVIALLSRSLSRRGFVLGHDAGRLNRQVNANLMDDLAGLRTIKQLDAVGRRRAALLDRLEDMQDNHKRQQHIRSGEKAALQIVASMAAVVTLYASVALLHIPLAEALVLILAYSRLLQVGMNCLASWRMLVSTIGALADYDATLSLCRAAAEPSVGDMPPFSLQRHIQLRGVGLTYHLPEGSHQALQDISATIPAGGMTALIGSSGAGKSSLIDLLSGLVVAEQGDILIDDVRLSPETRGVWRKQTAVVPQDPFVFHDTIAANLRLAVPDASDSQLWDALDDAAAGTFVRALPQGLQTVVGDRGVRLSGGERQRIVLARALLSRPTFLILDEATASLDGENESFITQMLERLRGRCTVLVATHRPSTVLKADHVLLLQAGQLVAAGTWADVQSVAHDRLTALGMNNGAKPR